MWHTVSSRAVVEKTALFGCLLNPAFIITVAVKDDVLVILDGLLNHLVESSLKIRCTFQSVGVDLESLSNCTVQHNVCTGNTVGGAEHTELKLIAGKSKGRGSVTVGRITVELRKHINPELHLGLFSTLIRRIGLDSLKHSVQFVTQEDRHNGRRCFVCAETMIVACSRNRDTEKILIIVYRFDDGTQEQQELCIFIRRCAGRKQILTGIGGNRPVVVLAASVDPGERLLVKQANKTVSARNLLHNLHRKLVVVGCDIGGRIDRRQLVLSRSNLVVFRLCQDTQLPEFVIEFLHKGGNSRLDDTKVMVIHFLSLWRLCTEQGTSGKTKVGTLIVHFFCDKEIFLLGSDRTGYSLYAVVAEQFEDTECLLVKSLHRTQKRSLLVKGMTAVGAECGRNTQGLTLNKRVRRGIPCGITSCLKSGTKTTAGERRSIRLTLNKLFAGKFHNDTAIRRRRNKAVVLFCGDTGKRLEPMGIVCCSLGDRPILHSGGNCIGNADIQFCAFINGLFQ